MWLSSPWVEWEAVSIQKDHIFCELLPILVSRSQAFPATTSLIHFKQEESYTAMHVLNFKETPRPIWPRKCAWISFWLSQARLAQAELMIHSLTTCHCIVGHITPCPSGIPASCLTVHEIVALFHEQSDAAPSSKIALFRTIDFLVSCCVQKGIRD